MSLDSKIQSHIETCNHLNSKEVVGLFWFDLIRTHSFPDGPTDTEILCFIWFSGRLHERSEMKRDVQGKHRCILHISVPLPASLKLKHTHKQIWIYAWFFTYSHNGRFQLELYALNIATLGIFFLFASIEYCNAFSFCIITPDRLTTLHFFYLQAFYEMLWTVYCTSCCCFALEHPLVMIKDYNYLLFYLFGASKTHPRTN